MVCITLPDGSRREFDHPVSVHEVARSIGTGLGKAALAGRLAVDGEPARLVDASHVIDRDASLSIVTDKDPEGLDLIRHSTAHLLAYAVKSLFPDAQVTIGPVIENGFYYDFSYKRPFTPEDLEAIEKKMAELRDHRRIGRELDLFHFQDEAPGLIFWHPKGWTIWQQVEQYMRQVYQDNGYQEVKAPQILDLSLWKKTGHWDNYQENMFTTESENRVYGLKPMNCPGHVQIFNAGLHSYRELPLRYGEFGQCHRNEPSGSLHGMMRVRGFTQDDGHIFCTEDQLQEECAAFTRLLQKVYADFGFTEILYKVATRPEKRIGADEVWDKAEQALKDSLDLSHCDYEVSEGEGAFYGPKIEYTLKDAIGRHWQCGTIQVDFSMPARLGAEYVDAQDQRRTPVMLHRAILGSLERFIGMLIENHAGALPAWLAPHHAVVCCISDASAAYAEQLARDLKAQGLRVFADVRGEKITRKIREHSLQKIPYILVVGDKERESGAVSVRGRGNLDLGTMPVADFTARLKHEISTRQQGTEPAQA